MTAKYVYSKWNRLDRLDRVPRKEAEGIDEEKWSTLHHELATAKVKAVKSRELVKRTGGWDYS